MPAYKESKLVTIYGGSGFVGRHVVRVLAEAGYRIRVAVRRPELAGHLQPLGGVGQIHAVQANIRDEASVGHAAEGANIVINLVGILYQSGHQTFLEVQNKGAETVARAAKQAGAETLIHFSAIGADRTSTSKYAKSKAKGEAAVLEHFPSAILFRPSVIFGPEDNFFNMFASLVSHFPVIPLIGGGQTRLQPVYVEDVARAVLAAVEGKAMPGKIYELGGPEIFTLKEIFEKICKMTERKRLLVPEPFTVAKIQALFMGLMPKPMLTLDQVRLLAYDNVVSEEAQEQGRTLKGLGITDPHTVDAIVPAYLQRFKPHGQFSKGQV